MIDGNISMEEDTELRDLVVQTLENNGVLPKVRAQLRASVFLALEEQESVVNPEPLLSKTVKQYLENTEGKLLFSLVREFLEYFGLDYTISVYDPETYIGKDYNYIGRNKLSEKLGINTTEPLLGELLKNTLNNIINNKENKTNDSNNKKLNETTATTTTATATTTINNEETATTNFNNETFEISVSNIDHNNTTKTLSSNNNDDNDTEDDDGDDNDDDDDDDDDNSSDKADSISDFSHDIPINVTITDKKNNENMSINNATLRESTSVIDNDNEMKKKINNIIITDDNQNTSCSKQMTTFDNTNNIILNEHLNKYDDNNDNTNIKLNNVNTHNNAQYNNKIDIDKNFGKTVYFDEIINDGKNEKINLKNSDTLLGHLPPIVVNKNNSIFSDLPPLNGKKTNINDLKELMDIGLVDTVDAVDNYEEDFVSSASGSANEQSPKKLIEKNNIKIDKKTKTDEINNSTRSEEITEDIDDIEEVLSANVSSVSDSIVI
ncbi:hypothetical protein HCN44_010657 [Aphidius gifuensis]|uniref:FGFR1 oncogene partner (FOP) N-terminal dimerisation domain-containing protein n=1 Tax=Aphidius gifuensis TaxID=684658 RepID=A0A834XS71_APHGI|nr:myb-like protein D isoform X2 [Aphidius gifuensis]KAF7991856.1 hypothetical protein HCN44_010657 [Aphidius gifuensis]